ncbi:MAG: hypothetical protein ABG776_13285 [Cyanobacteria bacterium J06555_13]
MYKLLKLSFAVIPLTLAAAPALAVPQNYQSHAACRSASDSVITALEDGRDLDIDSLSTRPVDQSSYPPNRPTNYSFVMRGGAALSVMNSSVMMTAIGADFLEGCSNAGAVSLGIWGSGIMATVGQVDGTYQLFQCAESLNLPTVGRDLPTPPWGYQYCGL